MVKWDKSLIDFLNINKIIIKTLTKNNKDREYILILSFRTLDVKNSIFFINKTQKIRNLKKKNVDCSGKFEKIFNK